jgi:ribosomal protein L24E
MATPHTPVFSGYLNKKGDGVMAGWKRRFFVLQDNTMFYFADEKAYKVSILCWCFLSSY